MSDTSDYRYLPVRADSESSQHDRSCAHWPDCALPRIDTMAREMLDIARLWDAPLETARRIDEGSGCLDLGRLSVLTSEADVVSAGFAAAIRIQALKDDLRLLIEQFARVSRWLSRSVAAGWDGTRSERPARATGAIMSESHRYVVRDWMWSDMNAQLALSLRLARKVLAPVQATSAALRDDLRGNCAYGRQLRAAAQVLVRVKAQAQEFYHFVDDADQRWCRFRLRLEVHGSELHALLPQADANASAREESATMWPPDA